MCELCKERTPEHRLYPLRFGPYWKGREWLLCRKCFIAKVKLHLPRLHVHWYFGVPSIRSEPQEFGFVSKKDRRQIEIDAAFRREFSRVGLVWDQTVRDDEGFWKIWDRSRRVPETVRMWAASQGATGVARCKRIDATSQAVTGAIETLNTHRKEFPRGNS